MKLDLNKFKKVSMDHRSTVLQHPDGHKITVAHAALKPEMKAALGKLPFMAEGGEVPDALKPSENSQPPPQMPAININLGGQPQGQVQAQPAPQAPAGPKSPDPNIISDEQWAAMPDQAKINYLYPGQGKGTPPVDQLSDKIAQVGQDAQQSHQQQLQQAGIPVPQSQPDMSQQQPMQQSGGQPQVMPQQAQGSGDQFGLGAYEKSLRQGMGLEQQGIAGEAQAQGALGQQQAQVEQQAQSQAQQRQADYQQHFDILSKERQAFLNDIQNSHIDPNHYINNMSTGDKVRTAIGLILGGIGAGAAGGDNPAITFLNKQIEHDIESQKANLENKNNLLAANFKQFGNLRDATDMTRIMQTDIIASQLKQAVDQSQDPLAKARGQQVLGKVLMDNGERLKGLAMTKSLMGGPGGQASGDGGGDRVGDYINKLRVLDPKRADEMSKRYVPGLGVGTTDIPDKVREEMAARNDVNQKLQSLIQFGEKNSGSLDPLKIKQGGAMARDLQDAVRRANGQGVFREAEAKFMNSIISDNPTQFLARYRSLPAYKQALSDNMATLNSTKKAYGFPVSQGISEQQGWKLGK